MRTCSSRMMRDVPQHTASQAVHERVLYGENLSALRINNSRCGYGNARPADRPILNVIYMRESLRTFPRLRPFPSNASALAVARGVVR